MGMVQMYVMSSSITEYHYMLTLLCISFKWEDILDENNSIKRSTPHGRKELIMNILDSGLGYFFVTKYSYIVS